jgi:hypothetical protein
MNKSSVVYDGLLRLNVCIVKRCKESRRISYFQNFLYIPNIRARMSKEPSKSLKNFNYKFPRYEDFYFKQFKIIYRRLPVEFK